MTWPPADESNGPARGDAAQLGQAVDAQPYQYPVHGQPYGQQPGYPPAPYGQQPGYGYPPYGFARPPSNPMGVAGFVCGLCGLLLFWIPFGGQILGVLGIWFGSAGIAHRGRTGAGAGMAIAGLVLGIIAVLIGLASTVALIRGEY